MKKFVAVLIVIALGAPALAAAVEGAQVLYVGGSVPTVKEGALGKFETNREDALVFNYTDGKLEIPYRAIRSFQYSERLARHYGVILTIAVVLVKHRQRRHFVEITYRNEDGTSHAAVFEVSKEMAQPIVATLEARSPKPCPPATPGSGGAQTASAQACRIPAQPLYID